MHEHTPITDKEVLKSIEAVVRFGIRGGEVTVEQQLVSANFARKLERNVYEAEREIKDLTIRAQKAEAEAKNYRRALTLVHDELLRGHDDITLLNMLEAGYRGTLFND
jgi:molecular chaperone GrpE (heat shock protein)